MRDCARQTIYCIIQIIQLAPATVTCTFTSSLKELIASCHIVDYNFFYLKVRQNVRARVRA